MKNTCWLLLFFMLSMLGCEGKQGPAGPPGSGTKIVYSGTALTDEYTVEIGELYLDDFPSINCYYLYDGSWSELYLDYVREDENVFPYALIEEQKVILYGLKDLQYKIVLVI